MLLQIDQKFDWCVELLATVSLLLISSGHLQIQGMEAKEGLGKGQGSRLYIPTLCQSVRVECCRDSSELCKSFNY